MKRCALTVLGLYALFLIVIIGPLAFLLSELPSLNTSAWKIYIALPFWIILAVMVLAQWLLIRTPVEPPQGRPHKRANVIIPIVTSGFLASILLAGLYFSMHFIVFGEGDKVPEIGQKVKAMISDDALQFLNTHGGLLFWGSLLMMWIVWSVVFSFVDYRKEPQTALARQCQLLIAGSLLELLVAVPSHVIIRMRHYCCAGIFTFLAIAFGIAIMAIAFGPSILALFIARWKRLKAAKAETD